MHVRPVIESVRASLVGHASLAGDDPSIDAAVAQLIDSLGSALQQAALELAQQAAAEVSAQLSDQAVDVVLVDGDPSLRVREDVGGGAAPAAEEFDARITLRLPPSLKGLIEESANAGGDSVNAWVVDALTRRAHRAAPTGKRVTESFDL